MLRLLAIVALCATALSAPVGFQVEESVNYTQIATGKFGGKLYTIQETFYKDKAYLVDVFGSRSEMGYDWGFLVGVQAQNSYQSLMNSIMGKRQPYLQPLVEIFLDYQWTHYLSKELPKEYTEELEGVDKGGKDAGVTDLGKKCTRGIVLANFPSDNEDLEAMLIDELLNRRNVMDKKTIEGFEKLLTEVKTSGTGWVGFMCSMFAIWGDRTENRRLFSARNLDWSKDTGIAKNKLVSVFHPKDKHAHATIGFAGLYGALAGMSERGLSVHEANLEEKANTFRGFPWVLRLRYVMENAASLDEAKLLWQKTNNTVGFNHMVTSAKDAATSDRGAIVFETMAGYTAYFEDNDKREQEASYYNKETNTTTQLGFPLKHALWRTNNGFDPRSIKDYQWSLEHGAGNNSEYRYMIIHDAFVSYNQTNTPVGLLEAINVTAILGSKGHNYYLCQQPYDDGSNVLSVTFAPTDNTFYAAWEDGTGKSWTPACCNAYVRIDMNLWFKS